MTRRVWLSIQLCAAVGGILLFQSSLRAEPAPRSEEELNSLSDLIVEVDVYSVTMEAQGEYAAWLDVRQILKGQPPANRFLYRFNPPTGMLGERNENVFAGQHLRVYLVFEHGRYQAWATNSIELLENFPEERRIFPEEVGGVIFADGRSATVQSSQCYRRCCYCRRCCRRSRCCRKR